ncbi:MAG: hypothetical protein Q4C80_07130 [Bacillota bacterium]|nr:hypothetical protein [Bacillota bacterium]
MQDFLNKVGKKASRAADIAGNKASEVMEVTRLKSKLNDINQVKNAAKSDIGGYCFTMYKSGKIEDPNIIELCKKIESAIEAAEHIESEIEAAKAEYAARIDSGNPSLND